MSWFYDTIGGLATGFTSLINGYLPGLGTLISDATDGRSKRKVQKELQDIILKYGKNNTKLQKTVDAIDQQLADLRSSPSRATNVSATANTLRQIRNELNMQIAKNNAAANIMSQASTSIGTGNTISASLQKKILDETKRLADQYEQEVNE